VPLETIGREFAAHPEADVELNARIEAEVRFNTVFPRAVAIRRVYEGGRDWWAVVFPLTADYLKEHPQSSGRGREAYLHSDGSHIYVSEFEVDLSRVERLCSE
jgi:hypothetical protein